MSTKPKLPPETNQSPAAELANDKNRFQKFHQSSTPVLNQKPNLTRHSPSPTQTIPSTTELDTAISYRPVLPELDAGGDTSPISTPTPPPRLSPWPMFLAQCRPIVASVRVIVAKLMS